MQTNVEVSTILYRRLTGGLIKKAAHICEVSESTVYAWAEGQNRVPDIQLIRLMRAFPEIARDLLGPELLVVRADSTPFCGFTTNERLMEASHILAQALSDGKITHDERPGLHNAFYRLWSHLGRRLPGLAL